jgi:hypothetical protein
VLTSAIWYVRCVNPNIFQSGTNPMTRPETLANLSPLPAQEPPRGLESFAADSLMVNASANEERAV